MSAATQPLVMQRKPVRSADEDFAPALVQTRRTRYVPGIYTVRCVAVRQRRIFGAHKCELEFQFLGTEDSVCAYLHMGRGAKPEVRSGSNYTKLWIEASGGHRSSRMSSRIFRWAFFEVEVGDCTKRHDGEAHAEPYSVVKRIIKLVQR
jgi:hypothetical protein